MGIVLCYHSTPGQFRSMFPGEVSSSRVLAHVNLLKKFFKFVSLEKVSESWRSISITFDDGYSNNFAIIKHLNEANIPTTLFISNGYVEEGLPFYWDIFEISESTHKETKDFLKSSSAKERLDFSRNAIKDTKIANLLTQNELWPLNESQIKVLSRSSYCEIGAHTYSHVSLGLNNVEFEDEFFSSIKRIGELSKKRINHFAFPFGTREDQINIINTNLTLWTTEAFEVNSTSPVNRKPRLVAGDWLPSRLIYEILKTFIRSRKFRI